MLHWLRTPRSPRCHGVTRSFASPPESNNLEYTFFFQSNIPCLERKHSVTFEKLEAFSFLKFVIRDLKWPRVRIVHAWVRSAYLYKVRTRTVVQSSGLPCEYSYFPIWKYYISSVNKAVSVNKHLTPLCNVRTRDVWCRGAS